MTCARSQRVFATSAPASCAIAGVGRHAGELMGIGPEEGIDTGLGGLGPPNLP
jgi:hypothetical protein